MRWRRAVSENVWWTNDCLPADDEDRVADGARGLPEADPAPVPPELGGKVGVLGVRRRECRLVEDLAEPPTPLWGRAGSPFAAGDVGARAHAGPRDERGG